MLENKIMIRSAMNGMVMTMIPDKKSKKYATLCVCLEKPQIYNQIFTTHTKQKRTIFKNTQTQKVIDVEGETKKIYAEVIGYEYHGKSNQQWIVEQSEKKEGYFFIVGVNTGLVLEIEGGIDAEEMKIVQNTKYGNLNQLWKMESC